MSNTFAIPSLLDLIGVSALSAETHTQPQKPGASTMKLAEQTLGYGIGFNSTKPNKPNQVFANSGFVKMKVQKHVKHLTPSRAQTQIRLFYSPATCTNECLTSRTCTCPSNLVLPHGNAGVYHKRYL